MAGARRKTLAVSDLETWRRWSEDDTQPVASLRAQLLDRRQSEAMLAGTAAHQLLEQQREALLLDPTRRYTVEVTRNDGELEVIDLRFELADFEYLSLPAVRELPVEKTYDTTVGPVTVKGRLDAFDGVEVVDLKFTGKPDFEALVEGWQWRTYLDIVRAPKFRWEVFKMLPPLKRETAWRITERHPVRQFTYPGMDLEVLRAVDQCASVIDAAIPEYWTRYDRRPPAITPSFMSA